MICGGEMEEEKKFRGHAWTRKAWKERRAKILNNKKCKYCGAKENLVIHHPVYEKGNYEDYENLKRRDWADYEVLCRRCHFIWHRYGKHLCERCKKKFTSYEFCWDCKLIVEEEEEQFIEEQIKEDEERERKEEEKKGE